MLKIEVRGVEGRGKLHRPTEIIYGTIEFDKGILRPKPTNRAHSMLFRNLISDTITLDGDEISPVKEPEEWIRNIHRCNGHRLWTSQAKG